MSSLTDELFRTEIDAAFDPVTAKPGPVFGELDGIYIFSGLTNFPEFSVNNGIFNDTPFTLGYYSDVENPISFMAGIDVNLSTSTNTNGLAITSTFTNTDGTDFADWNDQTQDTQARLTANDITFTPYFLTALGDINLAVDLNVNFSENEGATLINTWAANNSTVVTSNYFETSGGVSLSPSPLFDFTRTKVSSSQDYRFSIDAQVPIYLPGEDKSGMLISPYLFFSLNDAGSTVAETFTNPADTTGGGNINNVTIQDDVVDSYSVIGGGAAYSNFSDGLGDHEDNQLVLEASIRALYGLPSTYSTTNIQQDYTYTGSGAVPTVSNIDNWTTTTTTREGELSGFASAGASNSFYFDLADDVVAGLKPGTSLLVSLDQANPDYNHDLVMTTTTKTDSSGDGTIVDADDTVTVTTTNYRNNGDGGNINGDLTLSLPGAVSFRPGNGIFTLYVSATPRAVFSLDLINNVSDSQVVQTVTTVAGTETGNVTTTDAAGTATFTALPGFDFELATGAGIRFHISDNGSIDFSLDSSTTGTRLRAEAVFSLP
jgi:hypothetical protein